VVDDQSVGASEPDASRPDVIAVVSGCTFGCSLGITTA
jgi:formylmethanofuran dehydrogenase subunit E